MEKARDCQECAGVFLGIACLTNNLLLAIAGSNEEEGRWCKSYLVEHLMTVLARLHNQGHGHEVEVRLVMQIETLICDGDLTKPRVAELVRATNDELRELILGKAAPKAT